MQGLHLVKCLAATQGPKIRVNAILPGLLLTEWVGAVGKSMSLRLMFQKGANFTPEQIQGAKDKAYLKMEVRGHDYCIRITANDASRRTLRTAQTDMLPQRRMAL